MEFHRNQLDEVWTACWQVILKKLPCVLFYVSTGLCVWACMSTCIKRACASESYICIFRFGYNSIGNFIYVTVLSYSTENAI